MLYLCVLVVATVLGEVSLRPARLYKVLPLLFLLAINIMGVLFLAIQHLSEGAATKKRIQVILAAQQLSKDAATKAY